MKRLCKTLLLHLAAVLAAVVGFSACHRDAKDDGNETPPTPVPVSLEFSLSAEYITSYLL